MTTPSDMLAPLDWKYSDDEDGNPRYDARMSLGWYFLVPIGSGWRWGYYMYDGYYDEVVPSCSSVDEAKALAWADWVKRATPILAEPKEKPYCWACAHEGTPGRIEILYNVEDVRAYAARTGWTITPLYSHPATIVPKADSLGTPSHEPSLDTAKQEGGE
jgi:hypothetical protein